MKIHYTLDDSAARLPLSIRSTEGVWDRAVDLRNAPGIHLVELTTQHMLNTGATLFDELSNYFDNNGPSESDPYQLGLCFDNRAMHEDLLRDVRDHEEDLTALEQVELLFPATFACNLHLTLSLTVVGYPAFGYVRTFKDSEGDEFHGMVVNLAQARPHLEEQIGEFSLSRLEDVVRHSFFNHHAFLLAYEEFCADIGRHPEKLVTRLKDALMSRGIAWYLSYAHDMAFYDEALGLAGLELNDLVARWNALIDVARKRSLGDENFDDWLRRQDCAEPGEMCSVDVLGYKLVSALVDEHGRGTLRDALTQGPTHFLKLANGLGTHFLRG